MSVQTVSIVSHQSVTEWMRRQLHAAINVAPRRFTAQSLADESGVGLSAIRSYMRNDVAKEAGLSNALSIAVVLGPKAVSSLMALIGYTATPVEDPDTINPMQVVADAMPHIGTIARAAADGRIDHTEEAATTEAADMLIATILPLSSHKDAQ